MLVYLMGSMSYYDKINQFDKAIEWRIKAKNYLKELNINVFDPTVKFDKNNTYPSEGVVTQNFMYLQKSDFALLNFEYLEESFGTAWEITNCWRDHKHIIAFGENKNPYQPHLKASAITQFATLNEALEYISNMYCQIV